MSCEEPFLPLSDWERRFESWRVTIGAILAPLAFAWIFWGLPADTQPGQPAPAAPAAQVPPRETGLAARGWNPRAQKLAAVMAAVVVLWVTEALPMPVTALLGAASCVLLGIAEAKAVFAPFADPLMFLFIGSFILARAISLHGLDKRLAFAVMSMSWVGARPGRILFAFGAVTAFISAGISNTATTAMMLAIGVSILRYLYGPEAGPQPIDRRYATGMALMTAFSASIGGLATPIGTPPNIIGITYIREQLHVDVAFFDWMMIGVPVVGVLYLVLFAYLSWFCPAGAAELTGSRELLAERRKSLGPWTRGQRSTLVAFLVTALLWIVPGIAALVAGESSAAYKFCRSHLPEGVVALLGAGLLFALPGEPGRRVLQWRDAAQIDWGVVLLYGGGFALGELSNQTGLADVVGRGITETLGLSGELGLLISATAVAALVSEATSNTASANIVVLLVIKMAQAAGVDPLAPALGATFGASLGFMLPVSTPCNAIVFGSGYVPLSRMVRYGALLDLLGVLVITALVWLLAPLAGS
jgi:sodium-dependent dicarboxylate transporter 2/3/5